MSGKEILLHDKELAAWWNTTVKDDRFAKVVALARAQLCESEISAEQVKGANLLILTLQHFAEGEITSIPLPSPGLHHSLEPKRPEKATEPKS